MNKLKIILIGFTILFNTIPAICQSNSISGKIVDKETGEVLVSANVYNLDNKKGSTTNGYGFFSIEIIPELENRIHVGYVGYSDTVVIIKPDHHQNLEIRLIPGTNLEEVTVNMKQTILIPNKANEAIRLNVNQIKLIPKTFGETDVIKSIQMLPGASAASESKSGLIVRGGSTDQNLILLDDVPLYVTGHFADFISIFNEDAINNVNFYQNGYPAYYGGRLSSVVDIKMKEGNSQRLSGGLSIGLLSAKCNIGGPIKKNKTTFIISARKSYVQYFKTIFDLNTDYSFYDLNLKINHKINPKNHIYFSLYSGNDNMANKLKGATETDYTESQLKWGNKMANIRLFSNWSSKLYSTFSTYYSKFNFNNTFDEKNVQKSSSNHFSSSVDDFGFNLKFEYYGIQHSRLIFGTQNNLRFFKPGNTSYQEMTADSISFFTEIFEKDQNFISSGFIDWNWNMLKNVELSAGLRTSLYSEQSYSKPYWEPRLSFKWQVSDKTSILCSYMKNTQFMHMIISNSNSIQANFWVPATNSHVPEVSHQVAFNLNSALNELYNFSIGAYYKEMDNLIQIKPGKSFYAKKTDWEDLILGGGLGYAYGTELLAEKSKGKLKGFVATTISKSIRSFTEINNGKLFPYQFDRLISSTISGNYDFNDHLNLSLNWNFATGNPLELPLQGYKLNDGSMVFIYNENDKIRGKTYHRLDLGINYTKHYKENIQLTYSAGLINAYNRKNPSYYTYGKNYGTGAYNLQAFILFPILPYFNVDFKF